MFGVAIDGKVSVSAIAWCPKYDNLRCPFRVVADLKAGEDVAIEVRQPAG